MDKRSEEEKRQDEYLEWLFSHPSLLCSGTGMPEYFEDRDKWFLTEEDWDSCIERNNIRNNN